MSVRGDRTLTADARVLTPGQPYGICGGQNGTVRRVYISIILVCPVNLSFHQCSILSTGSEAGSVGPLAGQVPNRKHSNTNLG
jgi:hypothetical protein